MWRERAPQGKTSSSRAASVPLLLVFGGIAVMIGCIPIPATRQFQPDGTPRPERAVGADPGKPVRVGHTRIDDAFIEMSRRVRMTMRGGWYSRVTSRTVPAWSILNWRVSPDRRQFALEYSVRTTTWIMPFCFQAEPKAETRWLILEVDSRGVVNRATTTKDLPSAWPTEVDQWMDVFDAPTRRKLQEAGVFPSDELLEQARRQREQRTTAPRPANANSAGK
jgi:hypothetical protein